jgi:hypothetical protein
MNTFEGNRVVGSDIGFWYDLSDFLVMNERICPSGMQI